MSDYQGSTEEGFARVEGLPRFRVCLGCAAMIPPGVRVRDGMPWTRLHSFVCVGDPLDDAHDQDHDYEAEHDK